MSPFDLLVHSFFNSGNFYLIISLNNCFCSTCYLFFSWNTYNSEASSPSSIHTMCSHCFQPLFFPQCLDRTFFVIIVVTIMLLFITCIWLFMTSLLLFTALIMLVHIFIFYNILLIYPTTVSSNMNSYSYFMAFLKSHRDASFLYFFLIPIINLSQKSTLSLCLLDDILPFFSCFYVWFFFSCLNKGSV